jgi:thiosulfate/3-mercaptopyruvate sulfurtransferase
MSATYRHPESLVTTEWLSRHLDDPRVRVFECTQYLRYRPEGSDAPYDVESGRADFDRAHIPGAGFLDVQQQLSDATSPPHLRFTLPAPDALAAAFARLGVGDGLRVVLYSRGRPVWATRVWWMLRAIGFDDAAVLDGGFEKWRAEGRALSTEAPALSAATLTPRPRPGLFVGKEEVVRAMSDPGTRVVNALAPDLHRGENGRYGRRGRIPGSVNVPAAALVDAGSNTFVPAADADRAFREAGVDPSARTLVYCGGGIAATLDAFLLHQLGHEELCVYDASMSEWARDESLPMETG